MSLFHSYVSACVRIAAAALLVSCSLYAQAQPDARSLLQKSFDTYNKMTSYAGAANTDQILEDEHGKGLSAVGTAVEIKYKRPNKLLLSFVAPVGSRIVWSNSKEFGEYDPNVHKFTLGQPKPTLDLLLPELFKAAQVAATYDPLFGLAGKKVPADMRDLKIKAQTTYNGHPVYVVSAVTPGDKPREWSWWIDRNTNLFLKIEMVSRNLKQKTIVQSGGKTTQGTRNVIFLIRTTITTSKPNANIPDSDFDYHPPKGATQRIPSADIGKKH